MINHTLVKTMTGSPHKPPFDPNAFPESTELVQTASSHPTSHGCLRGLGQFVVALALLFLFGWSIGQVSTRLTPAYLQTGISPVAFAATATRISFELEQALATRATAEARLATLAAPDAPSRQVRPAEATAPPAAIQRERPRSSDAERFNAGPTRTIEPVAGEIQATNAPVALLVQRVEMRANGRMRWHFEFHNRSDESWAVSTRLQDSLVADAAGTVYDVLATASYVSGPLAPDDRQRVWLEFAPPADAPYRFQINLGQNTTGQEAVRFPAFEVNLLQRQMQVLE